MAEISSRIGDHLSKPRTALNLIRPVGRQIADILIVHGECYRSHMRQARCQCWRKCASPTQRRGRRLPFEFNRRWCQRVMIAMALAMRAALLIADEPTTGLEHHDACEFWIYRRAAASQPHCRPLLTALSRFGL